MISPLVTPFILCFALRHKSIEIVDFLRHFTVEVVGVGDVCSFAQLDLHKHGHPHWQSSIPTEAMTDQNDQGTPPQKQLPQSSQSQTTELPYKQAEDGKTELSLIHFALTNPEWRPPRATEGFLNALRSQIQQELVTNPMILQPSILTSSLLAGGAVPYPMMHSMVRPNYLNLNSPQHQPEPKGLVIGRGITRNEGPRSLPENRVFVTR